MNLYYISFMKQGIIYWSFIKIFGSRRIYSSLWTSDLHLHFHLLHPILPLFPKIHLIFILSFFCEFLYHVSHRSSMFHQTGHHWNLLIFPFRVFHHWPILLNKSFFSLDQTLHQNLFFSRLPSSLGTI